VLVTVEVADGTVFISGLESDVAVMTSPRAGSRVEPKQVTAGANNAPS